MSDPVRAGKAEAAAVIWRWRKERDDRPARAARARKTALVRFIVAALAGGAFFYFGRVTVASIAWSVGSLTLLLALASPLGAYAAVDRLVARLGALIGTILTWLLLAPVFYLFFTPFGLLFRRGSRDPMRRGFEPSAATYWKRRNEPSSERDRAQLERPF